MSGIDPAELASFDQTLQARRVQLDSLLEVYRELAGKGFREEVLLIGMASWLHDQAHPTTISDLLAYAVHIIAAAPGTEENTHV